MVREVGDIYIYCSPLCVIYNKYLLLLNGHSLSRGNLMMVPANSINCSEKLANLSAKARFVIHRCQFGGAFVI